MVEERSYAADAAGMKAAAEFLDEVCINPRLSIVFDELASNIVRCSGATGFTVRFSDEDGIRLLISDDGREFDPTAVADPDTTLSAEERKIGGLGLLMVKKMTKSFVYRRENGRNVIETLF